MNPKVEHSNRRPSALTAHPPRAAHLACERDRTAESRDEFGRISLIAGWCNGSTKDSESFSLGSNPSPAANFDTIRSCTKLLHGEFEWGQVGQLESQPTVHPVVS